MGYRFGVPVGSLMRHDMRFLERHGNQYRVKVKVPAALREVIGKAHLKVPLHTDSLAKANMLKWSVVSDLKEQIAKAQRVAEAKAKGGDPVIVEAMEWREVIAKGDDVADDILLPERAEEIEKRHGTEAALAFVKVAKGRATPIQPLEPAWLAEANYAGRTETSRKQAVRVLLEWCRASSTPETVEAVDRKTAGRFISEVFIAKNADPATANKLITGLSAFWKWMEKRGHAAAGNPWERQSLKLKKVKTEEGEEAKRPFTNDEITKILAAAKGVLGDLCRLGALSGMRIGEMAELRVRNVKDGTIRVGQGKTDAATRDVPIHPDIVALVASRCEGKEADDYLFHELPDQQNAARPRGAPASQAFTRLLRELELEDRIPGRRQARIDFHSFRRWFMRMAVEALEKGATGFTAWTLAEVVGHSKESGPLPMTMGRYPGASRIEAKRACVEAVHLPKAKERADG